VAAVVVAGCGAAVLGLVGGTGWWALSLLGLGVVLVLAGVARSLVSVRWLGVVALVGAAVVAGRDVWSLGAPSVGRLLGDGAPGVAECAAWLLLVVTAGCAVIATVVRREPVRKERGSAVVLVGMVVAVAVGTWFGAGALADARVAAVRAADVDHSGYGPADPGRSPVAAEEATGPTGWAPAWQDDTDAYASTTLAVPGSDLAITFHYGEPAGDDRRSGVVARDVRTGEPRWHFRTGLWSAVFGVAVSPSTGQVLVGIADVAVVLDLDSGTELRRIALPASALEQDVHLLGAEPNRRSSTDGPPPARIELVGNAVAMAATRWSGPTGLITVNLLDGRVSVLAAAEPRDCRFRAVYPPVGAPAGLGWVIRDGVGCRRPRVTELAGGLPRADHEPPLTDGSCELGCELVDVFAVRGVLVVHTGTELLAIEDGRLVLRLPATADERGVAVPGASTPAVVPAPRPASVAVANGWYRVLDGRVRLVDPATGAAIGEPSPELPCATPTSVSATAGTVVVACGGERPVAVAFTSP